MKVNSDYRINSLIKRFENIQEILKLKSYNNLTSIKFRESCVYPSDYQHFIDYLKHDLSYTINSLDKNFEKIHIISNFNDNKIILIEHETGLELILSDISSAIGIISGVVAVWKFSRNKFNRHKYDRDDFKSQDDKIRIEIRKINSKNLLNEFKINNIEDYLFSVLYEENKNLVKRINKLEDEVKILKNKNKIKGGE